MPRRNRKNGSRRAKKKQKNGTKINTKKNDAKHQTKKSEDKYKTRDKLKKIDQLLLEIAKDEKTGFIQPKFLDDKLQANDQNSPFITSPLPSLMDFIDPARYLTNILDVDWDIIDKIKKNHKYSGSDDLNLKIKHISPCQEVFGIMQYLSMCGKINNNYYSFFDDAEFGTDKANNLIHDFLNNNNSAFSMLFVLIGLSQYNNVGGKIHYFCVIKLNNKYRLIQSFALHFRLESELKKRNWLNKQQINDILNGFIYLESVGINNKITDKDLINIKENSMLCLGFELLPEMDTKKRGKHEKIGAVIMKDLSFEEFVKSAEHLLGYMQLLLNKFEKRQFNHKDIPLCYRMGYPICTMPDYMKEINEKNGWGYKIQ